MSAVTKQATQRKALSSTFPENWWTLPTLRLHPTTTTETTESRRPLSIYSQTTRGNTLRVAKQDRNHGYAALVRRGKSRRRPRAMFLPRAV
jgi:hypothetical protein